MANKWHNKIKNIITREKDPMIEYVIEQFNAYDSHHKERFDEANKIYEH